MDYEVFLESRMREESLHQDPATAVTDGYAGSAKVVASAVIIMASVFASFILSPDPTIKSLGFALATGVLIDAFVIRMTVIPATMYLFKGAAWCCHDGWDGHCRISTSKAASSTCRYCSAPEERHR